MKNYRRQLDMLFNKARKAPAGTSLLSGDEIRNLLAESASTQQTTTIKQGVRPMIITGAATGLVALITAGTLFFTNTPQDIQPAAATSAITQTEARHNQADNRTETQSAEQSISRQSKHYSTPGIAGKEKAKNKEKAHSALVEIDRKHNPISSEENIPVDIGGIRMLELTDAELRNLGVEHKDDGVHIYQRRADNFISYIGVAKGGVSMNPAVEPKPEFPVLSDNYLRLVTDDLGQRRLEQYHDDSDKKELKATESFKFITPNHEDLSKSKVIEVIGTGSDKKTIERLATTEEVRELAADKEKRPELDRKISENVRAEKWIAISVKSDKPQDNSGKHWRTSYVLWYEPTAEVVAALPDRYRTELERELRLAPRVTDGSAAVSLPQQGFIGLWQTQSGAITSSSVYPNPVSNRAVTLSYTLSSPRNVNITLRSITGAVISRLDSRKQQAGTWTQEYKTGDIRPGMYLVSIETDNGEYSVQRLIVE